MDDDHANHLREGLDRIAAALEKQNGLLTRIASRLDEIATWAEEDSQGNRFVSVKTYD